MLALASASAPCHGLDASSRQGGRFAPAPGLSAHAASGSIPRRSLTAHRIFQGAFPPMISS